MVITMDIKELDKKYVANTYARADVTLVSGKGALVYDDTGKEYIDLGSGIAVNSFGCADPIWQAAVTEQISKLQHMSNLYYTEPCAKLAQMLCERTGMKKVFFGNSGAEANECAIKTARKWAFDKYGDDSHATIITLKNSFHGRTLATLSATGQDSLHTSFGPFLPGFVYASAQDAGEVRKLAQENKCCAVMMELCQGEGGVIALEKEYIDEVLEIVKTYDMLVIADEVQTGNGRTGTLYAYMQYGFTPDIVTTAKGLAGGLPIGACMLGEKVQDTLTAGSHGSTFGGNPVSCAAALSVLSRLDDKCLADIREKSAFLRSELSECKNIKAVTGIGLMIGLDCAKDAKEVAAGCRDKGVIVLTAHDRVRLLPPYCITDAELKRAVKILKEVIDE